MPQAPIRSSIANSPSNAGVQLATDASGLLMTSAGGEKSALNLTAATVIKATPGRVARVVVIAGGSTSGAFTLNDCATTGAAAASNEIFTLAFGATAGTAFVLDWPCLTGIVLSAVPGGSPILAVSFT